MNHVRVAAWVRVLMLEAGCPVGGEAGVLQAVCGPDDFDACMTECRMAMEKRGRK
jgi:hypothetical protein